MLQYLLLCKDVTLSTCHNDKSELNSSHITNAVVVVVVVVVKVVSVKKEEEEDFYFE